MKLHLADVEIEVREGTADDVPLLLSFIHSIAEFEKLEVTATEEMLRESMFGDRPAAHVLFAFADGQPAAYAVYFFTFSTMIGERGLWLDDLYVNPEFRSKGIAKAFMAYLADVAMKHDCGRFEWIVLDWNRRAIDFYEGLEASLLDEWRICRLEGEKIAGLAERLATIGRGADQ